MIRAALPSAAALILVATLACTDSAGLATRSVASVEVTLRHDELEPGQHDTATAVARDEFGAVIVDVGPVTWNSSFEVVAVVEAHAGGAGLLTASSPSASLTLSSPIVAGTTAEIRALASGNTEISATIGGIVGVRRVTVSNPAILINEVFPNGDLPGGWVEFFNPTARAVDMSGWTVTDRDLAHAFTIPDGVIIDSGGFVAVNEVTLPNQLDASDEVHLFSRYGIPSDGFAWTANTVGTSYARCPDGRGNLVVTTTPTRKAPNVCS